MSKKNILIVEDERISAEYLKEIVQEAGYNVVDICDKGADAIKSALHNKPDLIFMDIMLKDNISGSEAALKISSMIDTKIIFLTAYSDEEMLEYAIDSKAVNYLIKPYREEQILVALKVALRESSYTEEQNRVELENNYVCDIKDGKLYHFSSEVPLKEKKLKVITLLCKNIDQTVPYKQIIDTVYEKDAKVSALRTLISRLNKKLNHNLIENVSGVGYKISSKDSIE